VTEKTDRKIAYPTGKNNRTSIKILQGISGSNKENLGEHSAMN
jgi:hypothetical protein